MFIAVTGGTGFLGRHLVRHLVGEGHRVRCWYRPTSDRSGFENVAGSLDWLAGSLNDKPATSALVRGVNAVVHSALEWQRRGGFRASGQEDLEGFLEANLMGSLRLFQAAREAGVSRFVFISTCAVHEVILPDRPLDETHPLLLPLQYTPMKQRRQ